MAGQRHDLHHVASYLIWQMTAKTADRFEWMFTVYYRLLKVGGVVLIHANGTGNAKSQQWYDQQVTRSAAETGLELVKSTKDGRLHKWIKPDVLKKDKT